MATNIIFKTAAEHRTALGLGSLAVLESVPTNLLPAEEWIDNTTALPTVNEPGSVMVGPEVVTPYRVRGQTIYRRTIRGYMPNQAAFITKVNNVAGYVLFRQDNSTPIRAFGVAKSGSLSFPIQMEPDDTRLALGPVSAFSFTLFGQNPTMYIGYNNYSHARYNGVEFSLCLEYAR